MTDEQVANIVVIVIIVGLLAIGLLSMLVGRLVAAWDWMRGQMLDSLERAREEKARKDMSSRREYWAVDHAVDTPVVDNDNKAGQPIATPDNAINSMLSDNKAFDERVALLAQLYQAGIVTNLARAIEKGFNCSRSSKDDSTYQRVRKALDKHLQKGPQFVQDDGTIGPATYPVSGRRAAS
jgi:hypothetical protein